MSSAIDQLVAKFKKDALLKMVTGNTGEGKELHRLQGVLEPTQVALGCALAWGLQASHVPCHVPRLEVRVGEPRGGPAVDQGPHQIQQGPRG